MDVHLFLLPERMSGVNTIHDYLRRGFDIKEIEQSLSHKEWPPHDLSINGRSKSSLCCATFDKNQNLD